MIQYNEREKWFFSDKLLLKHGFSTRLIASFQTDSERINYLQKNLDGTSRICYLKQIHSAEIIPVIDEGFTQVGDGLICKKTLSKPVCLFVKTADCLPIFFYEKKQQIIAAVHCGYQGLQKRIIQKTLSFFQKLGGKMATIQAVIGPGIGECCYNKEGVFYNLTKNAILQLQEQGIRNEQIDYRIFCTKCQNDLFHSYRGENKQVSGQNLNFISL